MMEAADDGEGFGFLSVDKARARHSSSSFSPPPDVVSEMFSLDLNRDDSSDFSSLNASGTGNGAKLQNRFKSFLLMDEKENIQLKSPERFCQHLGARTEAKIKVVSIFGNTGDGKSHTMNHAFFDGKEVFKTSAEPASCTMGIWASFHRPQNVLCLDTEGLLGETSNENQQMRMLLKVLAVSDIVIYRTRAERLRSDMYKFLGTASMAFTKYFSGALQSLGLSVTPQSLGPAVIIFHETQNTEVLKENGVGGTEEDFLRESFAKLKLELQAFSSLRYVGVQTKRPPTNYEPLKMALEKELKNTTVRSPRQPKVIFETLLALNRTYNGELSALPINTFPEQYFTCTMTCKSCKARCQLSMGHLTASEDHKSSMPCTYQHQFENKVYLCLKCHLNGRQVVVTIKTQNSNDSSWLGLAKFAWSGSVIECPHCGEIYRSRQRWYGNKAPEETAVRPDIVHIWNDGGLADCGPTNSAQLVLDSVTYLTDAIGSVGAQPTKLIKSWVTDKIRPAYWQPDSEIIKCNDCKVHFEQMGLKKHHCRDCGKGFCSNCSKHRIPVLSRGWDTPVRVCNDCYAVLQKAQSTNGETSDTQVLDNGTEPDMTSSAGNNNPGDGDILVRKYGEVFLNTLSSLGAALEYPKDFIKDSARPAYWVPDAEAPCCHICKLFFGTPDEINSTTSLARIDSPANGKPMRRHRAAPGSDSSGNSSASNSPGATASSSYLVTDRRRHHCRACGNAICAACSEHRQPVPERGWPNDVRVCNQCYSIPG